MIVILILVAALLLYDTYKAESGRGFGFVAPTSIAGYAKQAGFSGGDLITAVAIAYAESGGDPNAYNPEVLAGNPEGKGSYGLWQINLNAHPEFEGSDLYDPQTNANAAFQIYSEAGNSFRPWATFQSGKYEENLDQANAELGLNDQPDPGADDNG